jgi:hypothetical protein
LSARNIIGGILLLALAAPAQGPAPDPIEIVRRSVERDWTDFESRKNYTYQEHSEFRQYASNGKIASVRSETHEVLILGGRPYERLTARNDKPLAAREERREQSKLDNELAKRQHESPAEQARYQKGRMEERAFIREIPDAFTFHFVGNGAVSNRPAWIIKARPKPGYRAVHAQAKDFAKVRATIWIEQETYHWVKVDADVLNTISVDFGLLRIAPGSSMHFEQTRVNDEIWLPSSMIVHFQARLALLRVLRGEYDIRYSNYRKFQSDSKIIMGQ